MAGEKRKKQARYLRNNMSLPEVLLWLKIQNDQLGFRINRQFPIGTYILDYYCRELHVAIEVDGGDHAFRKRKDQIRDAWLKDQGINVFRISARSVLKSPETAAQLLKDFLEEIEAQNS